MTQNVTYLHTRVVKISFRPIRWLCEPTITLLTALYRWLGSFFTYHCQIQSIKRACAVSNLIFIVVLVFCLIKQLQTESPYVYRPPTKLREGNVFSRVCLSVHGGGFMWPLPMIHWTSLYWDPSLWT